jgi:hypothetical protein
MVTEGKSPESKSKSSGDFDRLRSSIGSITVWRVEAKAAYPLQIAMEPLCRIDYLKIAIRAAASGKLLPSMRALSSVSAV